MFSSADSILGYVRKECAIPKIAFRKNLRRRRHFVKMLAAPLVRRRLAEGSFRAGEASPPVCTNQTRNQLPPQHIQRPLAFAAPAAFLS